MNAGRYLPSGQFTLMVVSIALAAGLVGGAELWAHPSQPQAQVTVADTQTAAGDDSNWEATLYAIQAQNASSSITAPSADTVNQILQAAQSPNITDSVAKSLVINLMDAKSQGLGDDIPTQEQITAAATTEINAAHATTTQYTAADVTVVAASPAALKAYGNGVIQVLDNHPAASENATLVILGDANDNQDETQLVKLEPIGEQYADIAQELAALPVPETLLPLHLEVINDYANIAASYADMETLVSDPLRGLAGVQNYESLLDEEARLFTNIAQNLNKDGILFSEDEPGSAWQNFLVSS